VLRGCHWRGQKVNEWVHERTSGVALLIMMMSSGSGTERTGGLIAEQRFHFKALFTFKQWSALGCIPPLYLITQVFVFLFWVAVVIYALADGPAGYAVGACIFSPFLWFANALLVRVICEVAAVILLVPDMLAAKPAVVAPDTLEGWGTGAAGPEPEAGGR
jgi:hypothetical protein